MPDHEARAFLNYALESLACAHNREGVMRITRHAARWLTRADGASFVLREGDFCFYADDEGIGPLWKGSRFPLDTCVSGWAMLHSEAVVIHDVYHDTRIPLAAYRPTFVRSLAMFPVGEPATAAIGVYWAHQHSAAAPELEYLRVLSDGAALALARCGAASD